MDIRPISPSDHQSFYDDFAGDVTFLQSPTYGQWRSDLGESTHAVGIYNDDQLVGVAQYQVINARRGKHLLCSHGPLLVGEWQAAALPVFLDWYKEQGRAHACAFVRMTPLLGNDSKNTFIDQVFQDAAPYMVNPSRSIILDVTLSEDEQLAQMKKTTRYEVRKAIKKELEVKVGNSPEDLDLFWDLHEATVSRQGFTPFARRSTESQLAAFGDDIQIFTTMVDGVPMASCIIVFDAHAGYYHQGASQRSKLPVAYAGLWAAMQHAKARGCTQFNLWGVSEADNKNHPWYGLSKFKRGFGGTEVEYIHAQDAQLSWKYTLTRMIESYRRKKRGYT